MRELIEEYCLLIVQLVEKNRAHETPPGYIVHKYNTRFPHYEQARIPVVEFPETPTPVSMWFLTEYYEISDDGTRRRMSQITKERLNLEKNYAIFTS